MTSFLQANGIQHCSTLRLTDWLNSLCRPWRKHKRPLKAKDPFIRDYIGSCRAIVTRHILRLTFLPLSWCSTEIYEQTLTSWNQQQWRMLFCITRTCRSNKGYNGLKNESSLQMTEYCQGTTVLDLNGSLQPSLCSVSYTVQTAAGLVWKRHIDQLLQSAAWPTDQSLVDGLDEPEISEMLCFWSLLLTVATSAIPTDEYGCCKCVCRAG